MWIYFFLGGEGGVITKSDFFRGGGAFLYMLWLFKVKVQIGNIFWAAKLQIFLGMPDIPDFFFDFFFGGWGGGVGGVG